MLLRISLVLVVAALFGRPAAGQQITKPAVPGAANFARLETTVACGGATTPEAVPEIKKMGFASIINLRLPTEAGANVDGEAAAAKTAGIKFYSIPFSGQSPRDDYGPAQRARIHSLRRRQPRRRHVDDQAARGRSLGHRASVHRSRGARAHQPRAETVCDRLRAIT